MEFNDPLCIYFITVKEEVEQLKGENIKLNAQVADLGSSVVK
jgi:hypothetical protein